MNLSQDLIDLFESDTEGLFDLPQRPTIKTPDDRLTESFKQIIEFVETNDKLPDIEAEDIGEASLASRLAGIRSNVEKVELLRPIDSLGLLDASMLESLAAPETIDELFEKDEFGIFENDGASILNVKNVPLAPVRPALEIAKRKRAQDFEEFKGGFIEQQSRLAAGDRKLSRYKGKIELVEGNYYVHEGIMLYVAEIGEKKRVYDRNKERVRVIYENGAESDMYMRSLSQRLMENGYTVIDADYVDERHTLSDEDTITGYIYVLSSLSQDPKISTIKDLYKIGFTTNSVAQRLFNAKNDPTYLMAEVKVVDNYIVTGKYNPQKIEHFLHRIFADALLQMTIIDTNGREYTPSEWYCVPLEVIEQAINLLYSGEITDYIYSNDIQKLVAVK